MVGIANSLGEPKNNLLSYCVKDFIMYTFVMYMIKRNFLNPYFSFYVFFLWNQLTYVITEIADAEPIY